MRILYISDRGEGGIKRHVQCLRACLPPEVAHYTIGEDEPFAGKNGHDLREWFQIRRAVKRFRPDVIHFHTPNFLMALYARLFCKAKRVCSWHTPTGGACRRGERIFFKLLGDCHYLPVSSNTWNGLRKWLPSAKGEVFFNPLRVPPSTSKLQPSTSPIIGMVGRNADQKDWPSFHRVADIVVADRPGVTVLNAGENGLCDGRAAIRRMDVFVMTSKHEQLPTTMLECFAEQTPICGFVPDGGTQDVLSFSSGPLKSVFIRERDCAKLAEIVKRLLGDAALRRAVIDDGWQILTQHFDAEKNVRGQLMDVYRKICHEA